MPSYNKGDVVFANFPQEEDKTVKNPRPCLVLAVNGNGVIAAKMTKTQLTAFWAYPIRKGNTDMCIGTIKYDSWINLNRRELVPFTDIRFYIGKLSSEVFSDIQSRFRSL